MKEKRLSVVVPVYNVEDYLETSVNSILAQSYPNMELILVDDGSTDHSGAICDELAEKHPNIAVIHQPNGGVSSARNTALKAKEKMLEEFPPDEELRYLTAGKIYVDLFPQLWIAYCNRDRDMYLRFKEGLRPYREPFYGGREISAAKKLRFAVLELLTSAHMPRGLVSKIGQMNSCRIKEKWGLQRLMAL